MFVKLFSRLQNHFLKNCRACRPTARGRHIFADPLFNFFRGLHLYMGWFSLELPTNIEVGFIVTHHLADGFHLRTPHRKWL